MTGVLGRRDDTEGKAQGDRQRLEGRSHKPRSVWSQREGAEERKPPSPEPLALLTPDCRLPVCRALVRGVMTSDKSPSLCEPSSPPLARGAQVTPSSQATYTAQFNDASKCPLQPVRIARP